MGKRIHGMPQAAKRTRALWASDSHNPFANTRSDVC
jgi:hypothetical protein